MLPFFDEPAPPIETLPFTVRMLARGGVVTAAPYVNLKVSCLVRLSDETAFLGSKFRVSTSKAP